MFSGGEDDNARIWDLRCVSSFGDKFDTLVLICVS